MAAVTLRVTRAAGLRFSVWLALIAILLHLYERNRALSRLPRTIVVAFKGRLGNQLFQVAAGEHFRQTVGGDVSVVYRRNNYSVETDLSDGLFRELPHFDTLGEACPAVPRRHRGLVAEQRYSCDLIPGERLSSICTEVDGFWQCPSYAAAGRKLVLKILQAAPQYSDARRKMRKLRKRTGGRPVVAVHVRRGDYTKRFNRGLLEPVGTEYYENAKRRLPSDAVYAVFSDDLKWCKNNLPDVFEDEVVFVREKDGLTSLIMMMMSDHNVIANSTFSWWAAFLNGNKRKIVVAPKRWFGDRVKTEIRIYPKGWIKA